jgi:hypothetical protein
MTSLQVVWCRGLASALLLTLSGTAVHVVAQPATGGVDTSFPWIGYWSLDFAAGVAANPQIPEEMRAGMAAEYADSPMTLRLDADGTYEVTMVMDGNTNRESGIWEPVHEDGMTMRVATRSEESLANGEQRTLYLTLVLDGLDAGTCIMEEDGHRVPMRRIQ